MITLRTNASRTVVARQLVAIAEQAGATCQLRDDEPDTIVVTAVWPEVSAMIDVSGLFDGGLMGHFYDARRPLRFGLWFDSVNEVHRGKATLYRDSTVGFVAAFERAARAIGSGEVFEP